MPKPKPTAKKPVAKRTAKGTFAKGASGNPGGRPQGLMQLVRERTNDGVELVDFAINVLRGVPVGADLEKLVEAGVDVAKGLERALGVPEMKDRMAALAWLGDRGFGKALQAVEVTGKDGGAVKVAALGKFTDDELEALERAADVVARAAALEAGDSAGESP